MFLIYLLVLAAFSTAVFVLARRAARRRALSAKPHSAAGYHGAWALIWAAVPALLILIAASSFDARIERTVLIASAPEAVQALDAPRRAAFIEDARIVGAGGMPRQIWTGDLSAALQEEAARAARVDGLPWPS